jgi:arylsulfatase A-like enzyme
MKKIPWLLPLLLAAAPVESRPNVVLVMADDQGWGDVGYYGHPVLKTPNLDAMAAAGLRLDRFYAQSPVCSPTRGSVLTGRHPNRFGCFQWGHALRPQEVTIAETLKAAGYATGHFGKWHLGSVRAGSPVSPGASGFDRWLSAENFYDNDPILSREGKAVPMKGESSMIAADAAIEFIRDQTKAGKPFLAVVWFGSPHNPHRASVEDKAAYAAQGEKADFYGEIAGLDRAFGKLREEISTLGIKKDTILWYCSDNGALPNLGVPGGRGKKGMVYEGGLRVPGILEFPARIPKPRITNAVAVTSDILPTILELTGVPLPAGNPPLDGVSLVPILDGNQENRSRPVGFWNHPTPGLPTANEPYMKELFEAQKKGEEGDRSRLLLDAAEIKKRYPEDAFPGHSAWLDWPWKLHRIGPAKGEPRLELYRLSDDPEEAKDLASAEPERVKRMSQELDGWLKSVVRSLNGGDYR